jgi:hypothetical protein
VLAYLVTHKPKTAGGVMDTAKEQPQVPLQQQVPAQQAPAQQVPEAGESGGSAKPKADEVPK